MGRESGLSEEKLLGLAGYAESEAFEEKERLALRYADLMTLSEEDVDDATFAALRSVYSPAELVELTATVALENFLSKFHRALRVESQGFCARLDAGVPVRRPAASGRLDPSV